VIRSIVYTLRCALVAMLAIAIVSARPAMMASHAIPDAQHRCGMAMPSHHSSHTDHGCSTTTEGSCCDDCMCACAIGSNVKKPVVVLVATYTHVATTIEHPVEIVRSRRPPALRLPPPLGPPLFTRN
jgi:hypothetical protein